jgi:glycosyltransferase involved in cell wall biosynthesis
VTHNGQRADQFCAILSNVAGLSGSSCSCRDELVGLLRNCSPAGDRGSLLSVVIPAFNSSSTIEATLQSVLANSVHVQLEVIVVDDGSLDSTAEIAEAILQSYSGRYIIATTINHGLAAARNLGVDLSKGRYISFVDSDDVVAPSSYQKLVSLGDTWDCDVVFGSSFVFSHDGGYLHQFYDEWVWNTVLGGNRFAVVSPFASPIVFAAEPSVCTRLWRTSFLRENSLRFPEGRLFEDCAITLKSLALSKQIGVLNEPFYYYRTGRKSSITSYRGSRRLDVLTTLTELISSEFPSLLTAEMGAYSLLSIQRVAFWGYQMIQPEYRKEYKRRLGELYSLVPPPWVAEAHRLYRDSDWPSTITNYRLRYGGRIPSLAEVHAVARRALRRSRK